MFSGIKRVMAWMSVAAVTLTLVGCVNTKRGLVRTMAEYEFTAITPPQTAWRVGSVVEVDSSSPTAPTLFTLPKPDALQGVAFPRMAPDVTLDHEDKLELSAGVSLPAEVQAELAVQGVTQYSVVAGGNYIELVPIDAFAKNVFPAMVPNPLPQHWKTALEEQQLFYINELWFARSLEYRFYTSGGVKVNAKAPTPAAIADWSAGVGFTWKDDGTLIYNGPDPICLGYKRRPIGPVGPDGTPVAQAAGKLGVVRARAGARPDSGIK